MTDNNLDKIIENLMAAKDAALLTKASFGFPNDRLVVVEVHSGGLDYQPQHPDDYIKERVRLHHGTWIVDPIDRAIELVNNIKTEGIDEAIKILEKSKL